MWVNECPFWFRGIRTKPLKALSFGFAFRGTVPLIDACEQVPYPQDLLCMNCNVRGLARSATGRLWSEADELWQEPRQVVRRTYGES